MVVPIMSARPSIELQVAPSRLPFRDSLPLAALRTLSPRVALALGAVYIIWSSTYLALQFMVADAPAFLTSGVRFFVAGALLYAFARLRGEVAPTAKQWAIS